MRRRDTWRAIHPGSMMGASTDERGSAYSFGSVFFTPRRFLVLGLRLVARRQPAGIRVCPHISNPEIHGRDCGGGAIFVLAVPRSGRSPAGVGTAAASPTGAPSEIIAAAASITSSFRRAADRPAVVHPSNLLPALRLMLPLAQPAAAAAMDDRRDRGPDLCREVRAIHARLLVP